MPDRAAGRPEQRGFAVGWEKRRRREEREKRRREKETMIRRRSEGLPRRGTFLLLPRSKFGAPRY